MQKFVLPGTDLHVSALCLGTAEIGVKTTEEETFRLLDRWLELGGNFVDTARIYSDWIPGETGRSERILGDWLMARRNRDRVVLATKGGHPPLRDLSVGRCGREDLERDLEASLRALRTDWVDLYWLHRDDPGRSVEEIMEGVHGLVTSGRIRYVGASNWKAERIRAANRYAVKAGLTPFCATQQLWNLGSRWMKPHPEAWRLETFDVEQERLHMELPLTAIPYNSQAGGFFSKLLEGDDQARARAMASQFWTPKNVGLAEVVRAIATRRQAPVGALVLSYLFAFPFPVVPIVGPHRTDQLEEAVYGSVYTMLPEDWEQLRVALSLGDPGEQD
ncbi:MAG: aldo/keto reductase [Verrucomicrobiia bacterium]